MYEVMARRYRPAAFDEVVGQEHIAATLKNAISRDRVAHAYIFTGGHGCGKTTMARILAKALVCDKGPTSEPCGVCPICIDVAAGRDADVLEIDGASNNGIEQIRQLREQAAYVPTRARYKIYIIDEVHMLSDGAFNALLKTLEEPPRHVKFILATTDPHKVPDTILSRCQRFDFRLVPPAKLSAFFRRLADQEQAAITDEALDAVAANAEGSVRDGLVLLDQLLSFADGEVTRQDVEGVRGVAPAESVAGVFVSFSRSDAAGALRIVDEVASRGTNVGDFLDQLIAFGRDLMVLVASDSTDGISAYGPARQTLLELGNGTLLETALLYLDVLAQARTRVRSRALTNPTVALEMAVARLAGLGGVTPVSEILSRLDALPPGEIVSGTTPKEILRPPLTEGSSLSAARTEEPPASLPSPPAGKAADHPLPDPHKPAEEPSPQPTRHPTTEAIPSETREAALPQTVSEKERVSARDSEGKTTVPEGDWVYTAPAAEDAPAVPQPRPDTQPTLTAEDAEALWERLLDRLAENHPADSRHMARIAFDGMEGDTIRLSGPPAAVEAWSDRRRRERLEESVAAVFGRPLRFELSERRVRRRPEGGTDPEAQYKLARHPSVERVRDLFDGVIVDCQTAAPSFPDEADEDEGDDE